MVKAVLAFKELINEKEYAGGKGSTLALLFQKGYPLPDGFIILPLAFEDNKLKSEAGCDAISVSPTLSMLRIGNLGQRIEEHASNIYLRI